MKGNVSLRRQALASLLWASLQQVSGQAINFVVSMVLARLLLPDDYGLMGMIYIFITISSSLAEAGMSSSLVRMRRPRQEDYSTVFFGNLFLCLLMYAVIFVAAPFIANFYGKEVLTCIIRVYSVTIILNSVSAVQVARMVKKLRFKKQMTLSIPSLVANAAVSIILAWMGYGVWSLVWGGVAKSAVYSAQLWIYSRWRPSPVFVRESFDRHFGFGMKMVATNLLSSLSASLYPFVIGKFFSSAQTGYFTQAETLKQLPISTLITPLSKVIYPVMSNVQSDDGKLRNIYAKMEQFCVIAVLPIMVLGMALSGQVLHLLFSERWVAAAPYLEIACLIGIFSMPGICNIYIFNIKGRNGLMLKINIIEKGITLLAVAAAIPLGIYFVLWSRFLLQVTAYFVISGFVCRLIGYSFRMLVWHLLPLVFMGALMWLGVTGLEMATEKLGYLVQLAICVPAGLLLYAGLVFVFRRNMLEEILGMLSDIPGFGKITGRIMWWKNTPRTTGPGIDNSNSEGSNL